MKLYTDEEFKQLEYETFDGHIELTVAVMPTNKVKINYYSYNGDLLDEDSPSDEAAKSWMWVCDVPNIDERLIVKVETSILDYTSNDGLAVTKIYHQTVKG